MMLQGVPGLIGESGDGGATTTAQAHESGGGELGGVGSISGGFSEEERGRIEEGERNSGGNRWPRQETLALLKIRSDMDVAFRDSSLKGPLWDAVSRKLAEVGYHRSAKKCKEKFENVYKYHKRTKEGRTSKRDGKTYRFCDQLEALETHPPPPPPLVKPVVPSITNNSSASPQLNTVPSTILNPTNISTVSQNNAINPTNPTMVSPKPAPAPQPAATTANHASIPLSNRNMSASLVSNSTSSSTASDEEPSERRRKRKKKWKDFFGRLMKEVMEKQEELQTKFLDTLEKRERERMMREEAWRVEEMEKMNREHDLLVQERSLAAAKDAAVITFLQKITGQQQTAQNPNAAMAQMPIQVQENLLPPPPLQPPRVLQQQPPVAPIPEPAAATGALMKSMDTSKMHNGSSGGENILSPSPSRWPKAEIQALIKLRTTLDMKYQESGPKGPLWEEISTSMRKLGYNRNAKRCKEKWENINKYYKKVKESSKTRPEDSKTCPYFHQLDAIYRKRAKTTDGSSSFDQMAPIMARPEQQWPLLPQEQQQQQQQQAESAMDDHESDNIHQNHDDDDDDGDDDEEDDEEEGGGYEIVTNKISSMASIE